MSHQARRGGRCSGENGRQTLDCGCWRDNLMQYRCPFHVATPELKQLLEGCVGYLMSLPNTQRPDAAWFAPISRLLAKIGGE